MNDFITVLNGIPADWKYATLIAAVIVVVLQLMKHWIEGLKPTTLVTLLSAFSFAASFVQWVIAHAAQNPGMLGDQTAKIIGIATILYRVAMQPLYNWMLARQAEKEANAKVAAAFNPPYTPPSLTLPPNIAEKIAAGTPQPVSVRADEVSF